jgi:hypothetical protein
MTVSPRQRPATCIAPVVASTASGLTSNEDLPRHEPWSTQHFPAVFCTHPSGFYPPATVWPMAEPSDLPRESNGGWQRKGGGIKIRPADWPTFLGVAARAVEVADADVSTVTAATDKVLRVRADEGDRVQHLDFQSGPDASVPRRTHATAPCWTIAIELPVESAAAYSDLAEHRLTPSAADSAPRSLSDASRGTPASSRWRRPARRPARGSTPSRWRQGSGATALRCGRR